MAKLIVLMGPTGAGKSVQGDYLAQELGGVHLSSGNLLRQDPEAAKMIANGKLAPAHEVERIVGEAIAEVPAEKPVILDGFPRTDSNLQWMDRELPKMNRPVTDVVLIELDAETIVKRLGDRARPDDTPEAIQMKLDEYERNTQPVVDHYEGLGVLKRVDGRGTKDEVRDLVRSALS
ncbi:MAG TPA: nucleoside monophosphate kinase [Candidatus Saccharimonadia bacterium]|jgi:adenylate kinase|nr:nucleoside monophosphate kinase [Candidatus Saccharimonadia bacterium]